MRKKLSQPTLAPTRKVTIGAVTGALTAIGLYAVDRLALTVPFVGDLLALPEVAAAAPIVVGFGVSYLVKDWQS